MLPSSTCQKQMIQTLLLLFPVLRQGNQPLKRESCVSSNFFFPSFLGCSNKNHTHRGLSFCPYSTLLRKSEACQLFFAYKLQFLKNRQCKSSLFMMQLYSEVGKFLFQSMLDYNSHNPCPLVYGQSYLS